MQLKVKEGPHKGAYEARWPARVPESAIVEERVGLVRYAPAALGMALATGAAALYVRTLAPSVMPGDYAEFQMCAAILGVPHPTGYPLYILLGKLFTLLPFGDVAYRVNLSSAVYMAGAAGLLYAVALRLLGYMRLRQWWWAAVVGASFFALAPTVWAMSLVARSYALNALLVGAVLFALVSWRQTGRALWFYASCALVGLSMAHHGTTYLLLPAYGFYLLTVELERRKRQAGAHPNSRLAKGLAVWALGFSPMLFLVYSFLWGAPYYWGNPTSWKDFLNLMQGGPFHNQVMAFGWGAQLERIVFGIGELSTQYTPAGILAGLVGLVAIWRNLRPEAALLSLMMLGNFFFAMNYGLVGYLYFIPTYLIWGILVAVGLTWLADGAVSLFGTPRRRVVVGAVSGGAIVVAIALGLSAIVARYPGLDQSGQTATRDEALALLNAAPQGASVYLDWEDISVVRFYRMVYGMRSDLTLHTGDPADWAKWAYCDLSNGVAAYVGEFSGAQPAVIARDFGTEPAPMGWRVTSVRNPARYEVPPCGACATCR